MRKIFFLNWQSGKHILLLLLLHTTKNLFKSKNTRGPTYNKRLETKIVADWELKVVVSRAEPIRITFDWRKQRMRTVDRQHVGKCGRFAGEWENENDDSAEQKTL